MTRAPVPAPTDEVVAALVMALREIALRKVADRSNRRTMRIMDGGRDSRGS